MHKILITRDLSKRDSECRSCVVKLLTQGIRAVPDIVDSISMPNIPRVGESIMLYKKRKKKVKYVRSIYISRRYIYIVWV